MQFVFYSLFIYMVHHVFHYIKENYTTKKEYDVYEIQSRKYQEIMNQIEAKNKMDSGGELILADPVQQSKYLEDSLLDVLKEEGAI